MKVFERYTLEELQEGIGGFFWTKSRADYNKMYTPYKVRLSYRAGYVEEVKGGPVSPKLGANRVMGNYGYDYLDSDILKAVHALEIPFREVPFYVNTGSELTRRILKFRLGKGK